MPMLTIIDHSPLTVKDIETAVIFYAKRRGMMRTPFQVGAETCTELNFGSRKINLYQQGREFEAKVAVPTPGPAKLCFTAGAPI